jgi:hypothetical protein
MNRKIRGKQQLFGPIHRRKRHALIIESVFASISETCAPQIVAGRAKIGS